MPREANGIHEQAKHIANAVTLLGAQNPIVVGQSYGAAVGLAWAMDDPEQIAALVSISGPSHPWDTGLSWQYQLLSSRVFGPIAATLATAYFGDSQLLAAFDTTFAPQIPPAHYSTSFASGLTLQRSVLLANAQQRAKLLDEIKALQPRLSSLAVPMEIVHGDLDRIVGVEYHAHRMIHESDLVHLTVLPGIGHMPHHVAQAEVIQAIERAAARAALH